MRILRVFPERNSYTPDDDMVAIGDPGLFRPPADEVHVSCAFTWHVKECKRLRRAWARFYKIVRLGGPAIDGEGDEFTPGRYVKRGITFTTRGCSHHCGWCLVRAPFRQIGIQDGHILQDNNILEAERSYFAAVVVMLNRQPKAAEFAGGLDARLLSYWHVEQLRSLRCIHELWFAADTDAALFPLSKARDKLDWLPRRKLRCFVLCAYNGQSMGEARARLERVWEAGFLPFAQLYQPPQKQRKVYSEDWRQLQREWCRPAAMMAMHGGKETENV